MPDIMGSSPEDREVLWAARQAEKRHASGLSWLETLEDLIDPADEFDRLLAATRREAFRRGYRAAKTKQTSQE